MPGLGRPQQVAREATRQVEEMEVLDLGGEAPDLPGQCGQERVTEGGLLVHEPVEGVAAEHVRLDRVDRDGGRGPRPAVEQRELTEEPAGTDRR